MECFEHCPARAAACIACSVGCIQGLVTGQQPSAFFFSFLHAAYNVNLNPNDGCYCAAGMQDLIPKTLNH